MTTKRTKRMAAAGTKPGIQLTARPINRAAKEQPSKQPRFIEGEQQQQIFYLSTLNWIKSAIENEPEYSSYSMDRDAWLSKIWHLEPHLAGVLNSVVSIDTNRGWSLEGGRNQVMRYTDILHGWMGAPGVIGWRPGISLASLSYYSTDIGGIVEIGRDQESGPLRGLYHVDSTRCVMNGSVDKPLTYVPQIVNKADPEKSKEQDWASTDFMRIASMISIAENMNGLGFCAVSRCLELTKLMVAVYEHDREQLGAKAPKGLLLLKGVSESQWDAVMEARKARLESEGFNYFDAVAVLASIGVDEIDAQLIALSQLPAGFNLQEFTSMLMYGYALCFGYDPSEFYPVQFGSLGRGTEMEIQHEKATGKGGLNFILALQEQLQRPDILPASLKFEFDQRDEQAEIDEANAQRAWAELYKTIRETGLQYDGQGGISRDEYRMMLADQNILPKEWTEVEEDVEATDEESVSSGDEKPAEESASQPAAPVPLPVAAAKLQARQRRMTRDRLLAQPFIWRLLDRFPKDDIVGYHWRGGYATIRTIWEQADTLLERVTFPVVQRRQADLLYESKAVTISTDDVNLALEEAKQIDQILLDLLLAQKVVKQSTVETQPAECG